MTEHALQSVFWRKALLMGLRHVPHRLQQASLPLWSVFFYLRVPSIRRAILQNQQRLARVAGGQPGRLARETAAFCTFANYCECVAATYRAHQGQPVDQRGDGFGITRLRRVVDQGRGAILVTGHLGNWQLGSYLLARDGFPDVAVVMAEDRSAGVQRIEETVRDRRVRVVYPRRSPLSVLALRSVLDRGELVAMQLDRPGPLGGISVPFLGGEAEFAAGPAALSRACGAPVVPVFFPTCAGQVRICLERPLRCASSGDRRRDQHELTARLGQIYQRYVLSYPDQWYNFDGSWHDGHDAATL